MQWGACGPFHFDVVICVCHVGYRFVRSSGNAPFGISYRIARDILAVDLFNLQCEWKFATLPGISGAYRWPEQRYGPLRAISAFPARYVDVTLHCLLYVGYRFTQLHDHLSAFMSLIEWFRVQSAMSLTDFWAAMLFGFGVTIRANFWVATHTGQVRPRRGGRRDCFEYHLMHLNFGFAIRVNFWAAIRAGFWVAMWFNFWAAIRVIILCLNVWVAMYFNF